MAGIISGALYKQTNVLKPTKPLLAGALEQPEQKDATVPTAAPVPTVDASKTAQPLGVATKTTALAPPPVAPAAPKPVLKLAPTPTTGAPGERVSYGGYSGTVDAGGVARIDANAFNPSVGDWGQYQPTGDKFTGIRDGKNWFRGVAFSPEHLNQGDANNPYGAGFGNWLRQHIPILLSQLPANDPERAGLEAALAQAGGPLRGDAPLPVPGGPPAATTTTTTPPPAGNPITRGPGTPPPPPGADPNTTDPNRPPGSTPRTPSGPWSPTAGIIDQIRGIDPATIEGSSYDPAAVPETEKAAATGYEATGYEAKTHDENLSQAISRITDAGGPLIERAQAQGLQQANKRGLMNSSMAVESGVAAVLDRAIQIGTGDIQAGQFNVQQQNEAMRFTADASNAAKQFTAAAQNQAAMFNTAESNKASLFAVEQANLASRFAAEMDQAAKESNATAFNQAKQRYVDAINTALAAQQDAANLARRDERLIAADKDKAQAAFDNELEKLNLTLTQRERESIRNMSGEMFNRYQTGINAGMLAEMEPEARQNWLHNYNAIWAATNYLPFEINMDAFPPTGSTTPPPEGEPPPTTPPPGNPPPGNPINRGDGPPL